MKNSRAAARLRLEVQYCEDEGEPPSPRLVRRFLKAALAKPARLNVRFVDKSEARRLNSRFRGRRYVPDVLAFPDPDCAPGAIAGDIAVCPAVVERDAAADGIEIRERYAHTLVHAALHLAGHSHDRLGRRTLMRRREAAALARLGLADPWRREAQ